MVYRRGALLKSLSGLQIFLIVFSVFSFAFLISESSSVSAQAVGENSDYSGGDTGPGIINPGKDYNPTQKGVEPPPPSSVVLKSGATAPNQISKYIANVDEFRTIDIGGNAGAVPAGKIGGFSAPDANGAVNVIGTDGTVLREGMSKAEYAKVSADISAAGGKEIGQFSGPLGTSGWFGHIASGLSWALLVVGAIQMVGGLAGWDDSLTNVLSIAATAGIRNY